MGSKIVFTVGHSNHPVEFFLELLNAHQINCVIDVRSVAASAYSPQFNKEFLSSFLKRNNIQYLHFAEEFGARHTEKELLDEEGRVDFEKVRATKAFTRGVERLNEGLEKKFRMALMCSEANPFDCHRYSMISVHLAANGFEVKHILKDKSLLDNTALEKILLKKYAKKIPLPTIFEPNVKKEDQLSVAYKLRNKDIAFSSQESLP
jgi:uncharacterized protein (DUF488 family)